MEGSKRRFFSLSVTPWGLLEVGITLSCLGTIAGFLGALWPPFDLAAHFRPQYFLLLLGAGLISLIGNRFRWWLPAFIFALPNLVIILPYYCGDPSVNSEEKTHKCIAANLNSRNQNYGKVCSFFESESPDFMVLTEVTPKWLDVLKKKLPQYTYFVSRPRRDNFGIAMFSRVSLNNARIQRFESPEFPSTIAVIHLGKQRITVIGTHPPPPAGTEMIYEHKKMLEHLAELIAGTEFPCIVLGDLNMTPWSSMFNQFVRRAGLKDSRKGFGILPTWPATIIPFLIPIDHCLVSEDVKIKSVRTGPNIGSDHYPLVVEFSLVQSSYE